MGSDWVVIFLFERRWQSCFATMDVQKEQKKKNIEQAEEKSVLLVNTHTGDEAN